MIDTIALLLTNDQFLITKPELFHPHANWAYKSTSALGNKGYISSKQNMSVADKTHGRYKPRLTLTKRVNKPSVQITLRIEFSAPKLLFGNNFDEVTQEQLKEIILKLHRVLLEMGVKTSVQTLVNSSVSAIHYSKNIPLTNGQSTLPILKEIYKANISKRLDSNQTDFRNEGHSIKYRNNSLEITFYDKIRDLEFASISEKRALENDNSIQLTIAKKLAEYKKKKPLEVLRMEVRLNTKRKIKSVLKNIGLLHELRLKDLFRLETSQKVLINYLDMIENNLPKTLCYTESSITDTLSSIIINNPKTKIKDIFALLGLHKSLKELSVRELRAMFGNTTPTSWYRFVKKMSGFDIPRNRGSPLQPIRQTIINYLPLKINEYIIYSEKEK